MSGPQGCQELNGSLCTVRGGSTIATQAAAAAATATATAAT